MIIRSARYLLEAGNPVLAIDLDDRTARLCADSQKPFVASAGWVFLGPEFADSAETARIRTRDGKAVTIAGCTRDPRIMSLYIRFLADANSDHFRPGPLSIPS